MIKHPMSIIRTGPETTLPTRLTIKADSHAGLIATIAALAEEGLPEVPWGFSDHLQWPAALVEWGDGDGQS